MKYNYTTKYDFKNALTEQKIKNVFLMLNRRSDIEGITVQDICSEAGISRSTFYRHFHDVYEVIEDIEKEVLEEFTAMRTPGSIRIGDMDEHETRKSLLRLFHNCRFRRAEMLTLIDSGKYPVSCRRFRETVYSNLKADYAVYDRGDPIAFDFFMNYVAGTVLDLIVIWLKEDRLTYREFVSLYLKIMKTDLQLLESLGENEGGKSA